ncbi:Spliceosome-associated protein CWC15-like protein [Armadillidium vulgare]|nr:Spliceosome-associated protein CWC15-like protein [Armadillidium vulgare]
MTTAARPTFEPAKGGMGRGERDLSALSKQYSARDLPSHTRLKYREHGQSSAEEIRSRDFRRELEERERTVQDKRRKQEERIRMENIISGNPLLNITGAPKSDMKVRRRWDDDVVFKNCGGGDQKQEKTFINDSLRSEFHKRFMEKYIK